MSFGHRCLKHQWDPRIGLVFRPEGSETSPELCHRARETTPGLAGLRPIATTLDYTPFLHLLGPFLLETDSERF